ncbi:hypothetical protein GCM10009733_086170 [Nonomuraea maheshkhaliensis]|uniref:DUF4352 domain-containing protein n=1 Tax=Nonomuraea maheshkhaliensis TaxID=419590 RepID=A0ABN2GS55_9ACTN
MLLLSGGAAVAMVLTDTGGGPVADGANLVIPSREPLGNPSAQDTTDPAAGQAGQDAAGQAVQDPTGQAVQDSAGPAGRGPVAVGEAVALAGRTPGLRMSVTVNQVVAAATPASDLLKPKAGAKLVAVEVTLANTSQAVYGDAPSNGAWLIDTQGQQYRSTVYTVREGQSFGGSATINAGDSRKGMIVFEVPEGAVPAKFQFALDSGFAEQKGEWTLS